jgi:hypothetical protein
MSRFAAALALAVGLIFIVAAPGQAQTVNRQNVPAGEATPTGGTFSIRFPTSFTDVEFRADGDHPGDPAAVVRTLTGVSGDGIRFSATEMPFLPGKPPQPMEAFMEATKKRPGAIVAYVHHDHKDNAEILAFALTDFSGATYFNIVRTKDTQYMQVIQFPESQRSKAAGMKDDFFGSFKLTHS